MAIVDPMHNLFLGTAKHVIRVWKEKNLINENDFKGMQEKIDDIQCPADIGRLPRKIYTGFSGFTADQFKNWAIIFSMYVLKDYLPKEQLLCWQKFVQACRIICCQVITNQNIILADQLLLSFCKKFERLNGVDRITPNMHLHCHLKEYLQDFGPVYGFWLFSFERENGILGQFPNNNRNIEIQLMKKYLQHFNLCNIVKPGPYYDKFSGLLHIFQEDKSCEARGTLANTQQNAVYNPDFAQMSSRCCFLGNFKWHLNDHQLESMVTNKKPAVLSELDIVYVKNMYNHLYPELF